MLEPSDAVRQEIALRLNLVVIGTHYDVRGERILLHTSAPLIQPRFKILNKLDPLKSFGLDKFNIVEFQLVVTNCHGFS